MRGTRRVKIFPNFAGTYTDGQQSGTVFEPFQRVLDIPEVSWFDHLATCLPCGSSFYLQLHAAVVFSVPMQRYPLFTGLIPPGKVADFVLGDHLIRAGRDSYAVQLYSC